MACPSPANSKRTAAAASRWAASTRLLKEFFEQVKAEKGGEALEDQPKLHRAGNSVSKKALADLRRIWSYVAQDRPASTDALIHSSCCRPLAIMAIAASNRVNVVFAPGAIESRIHLLDVDAAMRTAGMACGARHLGGKRMRLVAVEATQALVDAGRSTVIAAAKLAEGVGGMTLDTKPLARVGRYPTARSPCRMGVAGRRLHEKCACS